MELLAILKWATGILGILVVALSGILIKIRLTKMDYKQMGKQEEREKCQKKCQADKKLLHAAYKEQIKHLQEHIDSIRPPIDNVDTG